MPPSSDRLSLRPGVLALAGLILFLAVGVARAQPAAHPSLDSISIGDLSTSLDAQQKFSGITYVRLAQKVVLSAPISGPGTLNYQWLRNGKPIAGVTSANYTISKFTTAGNYSVIVHSSALAANTTSGSVDLAVATVPAFNPPPKSEVAAAGAKVTFTVGVFSSPAATVVWQSSSDSMHWSNLTNSPPYSGVQTPNLLVSNVSHALSGLEYRVLATNYFGSTASAVAILTVPAPGLSSTLQGKYKITSLAVNFPVLGNVTVPLTAAAKLYKITLNGQGLPNLSPAILSALLRYAGLTTTPTVTLNYAQSTAIAYVGTVSGSAAYRGPAAIGTIKVTGVTGPVIGTVADSGIVTFLYTLDGTITVKTTPHSASTGTVTVVLTKSL